ncbi:MAG: GntR family transcriptional regulator, partial [Anaerolineaceae bacterium]|nr:GntR family transcriptional regulator [Anaerolineaceae bacterium]
MTLERDSVQPLYLQLESLLRDRIESGGAKAGDRLPPELSLARQYGISRMTVRRAINALVSENILGPQYRQGDGVVRPSNKVPFTGSTLSSFSGVMRGLGLDVRSRVITLELRPPPVRIASELRLHGGQAAAFLRRVRYINGEAIAIMSSWMPASCLAALQQADLTSEPITQVMERAVGISIVRADDWLEATLAREAEAQLLTIQVGDPVFLGRGVLYDDRGIPVRSSKVIYRGDRFRISFSAHTRAETEIRLPLNGRPEEKHWLAL